MATLMVWIDDVDVSRICEARPELGKPAPIRSELTIRGRILVELMPGEGYAVRFRDVDLLEMNMSLINSMFPVGVHVLKLSWGTSFSAEAPRMMGVYVNMTASATVTRRDSNANSGYEVVITFPFGYGEESTKDARELYRSIRRGSTEFLKEDWSQKPPIEVEVCTRLMDHRLVPEFKDGNFVGMVEAPRYHAQIKGRPGIWAAGDSPAEAVGSVIRCHGGEFGIKVTDLKGKHAR